MKNDELTELVQILNPNKEEGKLVLITRYGHDKIDGLLPGHIEAVKASGVPVVWQCDGVHGNTVTAKSVSAHCRPPPAARPPARAARRRPPSLPPLAAGGPEDARVRRRHVRMHEGPRDPQSCRHDARGRPPRAHRAGDGDRVPRRLGED